MKLFSKIERALVYIVISILPIINIGWATRIYVSFLKRWGVNFTGTPNYIANNTRLDGTNFSLISIGEGVTISGYCRLLTHDWSPHTVGKSMGVITDKPLGRTGSISIGDFSFIGRSSIIMPGTTIGRGCIIGAGTVVRGHIPDYSICIGNPSQIVSNTKEYMIKKFPKYTDVIKASTER